MQQSPQIPNGLIKKVPILDRFYIWILPIVVLAVFLSMHWGFFNFSWPHVGNDYSNYAPKLFDVALYEAINGKSIQWWTPSFGGGIPAYPCPQHTQLSLPQWLLPFFGLWGGIMATYLLLDTLAFFAVYWGLCFLTGENRGNLLAATIFVTNGFWLHQMGAAHMVFHSFMLIPFLLFCFKKNIPIVAAASWIAICTAYIIFSGGSPMIINFYLTAFILAGLLPLLYDNARDAWISFAIIALGGLLGIIASLSKLVAIASYMQQFPRIVDYKNLLPFPLNLCGILVQLFAWPFLIFLEKLIGIDAANALIILSGSSRKFAWEIETSLSPIALFFLLVGFSKLLTKWMYKTTWTFPWRKLLNSLPLMLTVWLAIEFSLGRGIFFPWLKHLPFLKSLHINCRYTSAFTLPLTILAWYVFKEWSKNWSKRLFRSIELMLVVLTLTFWWQSALRTHLGPGFWCEKFDITTMMDCWTAFQKGERFIPITTIKDVPSDQPFIQRVSDALPYEPLFGYFNEDFHPLTKDGPILSKDGDYFNMTMPTSLYAPRFYNRTVYDRFRLSEENDLKKFIERKKMNWPLPPWQRIANWISIFGLIIIGYLAVPHRYNVSMRGFIKNS